MAMGGTGGRLDDTDAGQADLADGEPAAGSGAEEADSRASLSARIAAIVFAAYLVVAAVVLLTRFGDGFWFSNDDWGFLDGRDLYSFRDLMRPQNGHWSTLPIVAFQVNYRLFGLRSLVPYQLLTVALHLTLCVLIRVVMRRAGVGPWIATVTASTFVLFGAGYENLLFPLQITLVGSLVLGITQLLLADHDGGIGWRDAVALFAGLLALMTSSVAIVMVVVVGAAALLRRGWRPALVQTAPLGAVYLTWYLWQRSEGTFDDPGLYTTAPDILGRWVRDSLVVAFESIGGSVPVAIAIGAVLVGGVALAVIHRGWTASRRSLAAPVALLGGSILLATFIGTSRALSVVLFPAAVESSRYQAMTAALVLPAIGVGAAELIRRQRLLAPVMVVLLVIGMPANIAAFDSSRVKFAKANHTNQRAFLLSAVASPYANDVDPDVHPDPYEFAGANVTIGFLRRAAKLGRLPDAPPPDPVRDEAASTRLRVSQSLLADPRPEGSCRTEQGALTVEGGRGAQYVLGSPANIAIRRDDGTFGTPVRYDILFAGPTLTSQLDQSFRVTPVPEATAVVWCPVE